MQVFYQNSAYVIGCIRIVFSNLLRYFYQRGYPGHKDEVVMKDLTDFAVIARSASTKLSNLGKAVLRVVPLGNAPTLTEALGGLLSHGNPTFHQNQNMTLEVDGSISESNIHSVQDRSNGYVRVVARINGSTLPEGVKPPQDYPTSLTNALGFALLKGIVEGENAPVTGWEVLAVASLKEGCNVTDGCYVAFTFSKTNNYQSVSFSPNAFATIEDLDKINGLDGLHIAFDHTSGDIKILDGEGNVLDQANLHMDADTIIADGEEGYKYVKTDVQQDIHAEKDFMLAGKTAGKTVGAEYYAPKTACFLVEVDDEVVSDGTPTHPIASARSAVSIAEDALKKASEQGDTAKAEVALAQAKSALAALELAAVEHLSIESIRKGDSLYIKGIRVYTENGGTRSSVDYTLSGDYNLITGHVGKFLKAESPTVGESKAIIEVYSPDAFVWTVGSDVGKGVAEDTFAQKMNAAATSMRFHVGDDIPLGTHISALIQLMGSGNAESPDKGFDAEKYMHEGTDSDYIDELVDAQRNLAKEELVAWNAQHPALFHDGLNGTRISSDGVDIRNGKIEIGNGSANADSDSVKRYVIETDIDDKGARTDKGLQISVVDSQTSSGDGEGATYSDVQKDILTINAEDYISGAPTCLALLKCSKDTSAGTVSASSASLDGGRITANFTASGAETNGVFTLTITDNRANNGFGDASRIVEIIPVYKSGADATEAVPAQRSISAIEKADTNTKKTLSIQCSQVIDWAQSIDLDPVNSDGKPAQNGMELYLIVKVY